MCEFSAKIPAIYRRLQLRRHAMRKVFSKSFSSKKSEKHPGNLSGIVLFVSLSMKKTVESWENKRKGKN